MVVHPLPLPPRRRTKRSPRTEGVAARQRGYTDFVAGVLVRPNADEPDTVTAGRGTGEGATNRRAFVLVSHHGPVHFEAVDGPGTLGDAECAPTVAVAAS